MFVISAFTTQEVIDKLAKQLRNIVEVIQVEYYSNDELITQEIALYKLSSKIFKESGTVDMIVREWSARIIEMNPAYVVVEKTGTREEIENMRTELEKPGNPDRVYAFGQRGAAPRAERKRIERTITNL